MTFGRKGLSILAGFIALTLSVSAQSTFDQVRAEVEKYYTRTEADGSKKVSKQYGRWLWFWEHRLNADGTFPTAQHYLNETRRISQRKRTEDVQAIPAWKELGPTAPDLPGLNSVWNGIGRINTIAISPVKQTDLWVGAAQGGLWKSTNGGGQWTFVEMPGFPIFGISDIAIAPSDPKVMYIATGDADASIPGEVSGFPGFSYGVIKSTDGGATWSETALLMKPDQNNIVSRIWVDPRNADIAVATTYTGIQKTTDGGATWRSTTSSGTFRDLVGNTQTIDMLYATTFSQTGGAGIYRSTNAGDSWELMQSFPAANRIRLAVTNADPKVVGAVASVAYTAEGVPSNGLEGVYKSTNYGVDFVDLNVSQNLLGWSSSGNDHNRGGQGFYDLAMTISPNNANNWFVGGVNTWRSTNGGSTWVLSNHWTGSNAPWVHADHHFSTYHPNLNRLYTTHDGGVARSDDNGVSWRDMSNGLKIQQYYGLSVSDQQASLTVAGSQDNGTARSTNGTSFQHVLDGDGMASAVDYVNPQTIYGSQPYGTFYRSDNQGGSFGMICSPGRVGEQGGAWVSPIVTDPKTFNMVYVGYTQLYRSTNGGASWSKLTNIPPTAYMRTIAVSPSNPKYIYIGYSTTMHFTTDGGVTWNEQSNIGQYIQDIAVHPTNPKKVWVTFGGFTSSSKIYEIDNGTVKNITGAGLPNVPCNAVTFQAGPLNRLYVGTDVGVFFKDENSTVWEPYGTGMPATIISGMEYLPTSEKLRVATYGRGVWEVNAVQCVAAKPTITATGPATVCSGDSVVLTAPNGWEKYRWSNGDEGQRIVLRSFAESGSYYVNVTDGNGCSNTSNTIQVDVLRAPVRPNITLRGPDTLRSSAIGGVTVFQWFLDGTAIPGATQRDYVAKVNGTYTVQVANGDGCTSVSNAYNFSGSVSSVHEDVTSTKIAAWPNPFDGSIMVTLPQTAGRTITVMALTGEVVATLQPMDQEQQVELNLASVASGTYLIRITAGTSVWSTTAVKR